MELADVSHAPHRAVYAGVLCDAYRLKGAANRRSPAREDHNFLPDDLSLLFVARLQSELPSAPTHTSCSPASSVTSTAPRPQQPPKRSLYSIRGAGATLPRETLVPASVALVQEYSQVGPDCSHRLLCRAGWPHAQSPGSRWRCCWPCSSPARWGSHSELSGCCRPAWLRVLACLSQSLGHI